MADTRKPGNKGSPKDVPAPGRRNTLTGEVVKIDPAKTMLDMVPEPVHSSRSTLQMQAPAVAAALGIGPATPPRAEPAALRPISGASAGADAKGRTPAESQSPPPVGPGAAPASPAPASPAHAAAIPPKIELVKHQLPEDNPVDRRLVLIRDPDSARSAAFRVLRHHLLDAGRPRVIAVSSASEREGKTITAVNLGLALAECGRARVLLIDANLKRPQLAGVFRFIPPWCFIEQLKAHREQPLSPWSFVELAGHTVHIAAINPRTGSLPTLDGQALTIALERLRLADYDHIVIDCPAVMGSADVNLVQDVADAVVLVSRSRKTTARDLRRAVEQLTPSKIAGIALLD